MGRRKRNYRAPEGLIRIPGSPFWWIKWKHIRKSTRETDLVRATIILREVQKRLLEQEDKVKGILGQSIPFEVLVNRYLKEVSPSKRSHGSDLTNSRKPREFFGQQKIDTIKPKDVYAFIDWRKRQTRELKRELKPGDPEPEKKSISGSTVNREKALISHAFKYAIRWGYVDTNPCVGVEGYGESSRERYITEEEFQAIKDIALSNEYSAHLADIMDCLYYTGQRCGRIFTLKWSQIDLKARKITFPILSKNKKVPDEIWISQPLLELLFRLKAQRSLSKVVGSYVFQKPNGTRYGSIKTTWNKCCAKANVADARIHDIRHKALTDLGKKGYTIQQVAQVAGHSQISTTFKYTHLRAEDTREALESLAR